MGDAAQRLSVALTALDAYSDRLADAGDLEAVIDAALVGIDDLCGSPTSLLLVNQPEIGRLVTLASRGYPTSGTGSEVVVGEGVIGMAAARQQTMRIGNLQRMLSYARSAQRSTGDVPVDEIRLPGLPDARSQIAAPMVSRGVLIGVLAVESNVASSFDDTHETLLTIAARMAACAFDREQMARSDDDPAPPGGAPPTTGHPSARSSATTIVVRHYSVDGSTFLDDRYLIKGVAGRLLWKVVFEQVSTGRTSFTNREAKLDKTLELPEYRDNFESRLILLKRRLEEHGAPIRIVAAGRGRFDVEIDVPVSLDLVRS